MNEFDRKNLLFLMTASPEALKAWYDSVGPDSHEYAEKLLEDFRAEMNLKVDLIADYDIKHVGDAQDVLKSFTLGKK